MTWDFSGSDESSRLSVFGSLLSSAFIESASLLTCISLACTSFDSVLFSNFGPSPSLSSTVSSAMARISAVSEISTLFACWTCDSESSGLSVGSVSSASAVCCLVSSFGDSLTFDISVSFWSSASSVFSSNVCSTCNWFFLGSETSSGFSAFGSVISSACETASPICGSSLCICLTDTIVESES